MTTPTPTRISKDTAMEVTPNSTGYETETGTHAKELPKPPKEYPAGRRCHCGVRLSVYNPDDQCNKHRRLKRKSLTDREIQKERPD